MSIAEDVIKSKEDVKKVLILEHPPRFDPKSKDPLCLKPELARYANSLYQQLWFQSQLKHKIVLGKHNLECSEQIQLQRFTDRRTNKYDGVHMYSKEGKWAYTESVISILSRNISAQAPRLRPRPNLSENQKNFPQAEQMRTPLTQTYSQSCSVPVQNRFNVLGN